MRRLRHAAVLLFFPILFLLAVGWDIALVAALAQFCVFPYQTVVSVYEIFGKKVK